MHSAAFHQSEDPQAARTGRGMRPRSAVSGTMGETSGSFTGGSALHWINAWRRARNRASRAKLRAVLPENVQNKSLDDRLAVNKAPTFGPISIGRAGVSYRILDGHPGRMFEAFDCLRPSRPCSTRDRGARRSDLNACTVAGTMMRCSPAPLRD